MSNKHIKKRTGQLRRAEKKAKAAAERSQAPMQQPPNPFGQPAPQQQRPQQQLGGGYARPFGGMPAPGAEGQPMRVAGTNPMMPSPVFVPPFAQNEHRNLSAGGIEAAPTVSPNNQSVRVARGGGGAGMGGARVVGGGGLDDPSMARPRVKSVAAPVPRAVHQQGAAQALQSGTLTPEALAQMSEQQAAPPMDPQVAQVMAIVPTLPEIGQQVFALFTELGADPVTALSWLQQPQGIPPQVLQQLDVSVHQALGLVSPDETPAPQTPPQGASLPGQPVAFPPQAAPQAAPFSMGATPPGLGPQVPQVPQAPMQPVQAPPQAPWVPSPTPGAPPVQTVPSVPPNLRPGHLHQPGMTQPQGAPQGGEFPQRNQAAVGRDIRQSVPRGARVVQAAQASTMRQRDPNSRGLEVRHVEPRMTPEEVARMRGETVREAETPRSSPHADPVDVMVWITIFRRPQLLAPQVGALEQGSRPPRTIAAFVNAGEMPLDEQTLAALPQVRSNQNLGPWPRFWHALQSASKYVVVLDDDVIPAPQWLESCVALCERENVIVSTSGIIYAEDNADSEYRVGPHNPPQEVTPVDVGTQGWFMRTELLWRLMQRPIRVYNATTGWDIHLAAAAQELEIPIAVLPYTQQTAGTMILPSDDQNSLSAASNAHTLRQAVYQSYREGGWIPACASTGPTGVVDSASEAATPFTEGAPNTAKMPELKQVEPETKAPDDEQAPPPASS